MNLQRLCGMRIKLYIGEPDLNEQE